MEINQVSHISYTNYNRKCNCIFRNLKISSDIETLQKKQQNKRQILGIIFHRLLKDSIKNIKACDDFEYLEKIYTSIENQIKDELNENDDPLGSTISFWPEKKSIIRSVQLYNRIKDQSSISREVVLFSVDKHVKGIIDEILENKNRISLIEYKFKNEIEGLYNEDYYNQLHVYAGLVYDNYKKFPDEIIIRGLDGCQIDIQISKNRSEEIINKMKSYKEYINSKILNSECEEELCNPSVEFCPTCHKNLICPIVSNACSYKYFSSLITLAKFRVLSHDKNNYKVEGIGGCLKSKSNYTLQIKKNIQHEWNIDEVIIVKDVQFDKNKSSLRIIERSEVFRDL